MGESPARTLREKNQKHYKNHRQNGNRTYDKQNGNHMYMQFSCEICNKYRHWARSSNTNGSSPSHIKLFDKHSMGVAGSSQTVHNHGLDKVNDGTALNSTILKGSS